ncbi:hypothetical protein B5X24_HaOG215943 [Helicoverpa armigera]|nr:hypothetical protein B5X24_HaOG215943 [Helicoverpa armigera]
MSATPSELAPSEMPVSDVEDVGEATPAPKIASFPPYPPYATEPAPPSVADTIIAGHDLRLQHKSIPRKPLRPPPKPARPRGPKATDVKMSQRAMRAHARCLRKHGAILTDRLERMSKPLRRNIIYMWREHAYTLPPETIARLRAMLDADEPFKPDQAYEYFINLKKTKKKAAATEQINEIKKDMLAMVGEKRFLWARNATVAFARGIQQRLSRPGRYSLADGMLRLSNIILDEICGYMHMRTPSRRSNHPKAKFMMEMADKVAVWIDEILSESDDRMLMMDFDEDDDIYGRHKGDGGDGGDGDGRYTDDDGGAPGQLLSAPPAYTKFHGNMKEAFEILTDTMDSKGGEKLISHGKFQQTFGEGADTLKRAKDFKATNYNVRVSDKIKQKLTAATKEIIPEHLEKVMNVMVDICSKYLAQNAENNKKKGKAFKLLVSAMKNKKNEKLYKRGKVQRTYAQAADELEKSESLDSEYDDPNLSQELYSAMSKAVKNLTPAEMQKEMADTLNVCSKYLSQKAVESAERGPVFDLLVKELNKAGGEKFSEDPALPTKSVAAHALKSAPGFSNARPDPATANMFKTALHKSVDAATPKHHTNEMKDIIDQSGNYLSAFARDRGPAMNALLGMMKTNPKNVFASRKDYTMDYDTAAEEIRNAPTIVPFLPVQDIADEGNAKLTKDMKDVTPPDLQIPMKVLINDASKHLSQAVAMRSGEPGDTYPMNFLAAVKKSLGTKPLYKYKSYGQTYADAGDTLENAGPIETTIPDVGSEMSVSTQPPLPSQSSVMSEEKPRKALKPGVKHEPSPAVELAHQIVAEMKRGVPTQLAPTVAEELKPTMDKAAMHLANHAVEKGDAMEYMVDLMKDKGEEKLGKLQGYDQTYTDGARRVENTPSLTNEKVDKSSYESVRRKLSDITKDKPNAKFAQQMPGIVADTAKFLSAPVPETDAEKRQVLGDLMAREGDKIIGEDGAYKMTYREGGEEIKNAPVGVTKAHDEKKNKEMVKKLEAVVPDKKMAAVLKESTKEGAAHLTDAVKGRGEAMKVIQESLKKEKNKEFIEVGDFNKTHEQIADMLTEAPNLKSENPSPVILEKVEHQLSVLPKDIPADKPLAKKHMEETSEIAAKYIATQATKESGLDNQQLAALDAAGFNADAKAAAEERRVAAVAAGPAGDKAAKAGATEEDEEEEDDGTGKKRKKRKPKTAGAAEDDRTKQKGTGDVSEAGAAGRTDAAAGGGRSDAAAGGGRSDVAAVAAMGAGPRSAGPGGTTVGPDGTVYAPDGTVQKGPGGAVLSKDTAGKASEKDKSGAVVQRHGEVVQGPGGVVKGEGGLVKGPGGVIKDEGGLVKGPGGVVQGPGGVAQGPEGGGVVLGPGGVVVGPGGGDQGPREVDQSLAGYIPSSSKAGSGHAPGAHGARGVPSAPGVTGLVPSGSGTKPAGVVYGPDGTAYGPDGTVYAPDGAVYATDGTVYLPDGTVYGPDGSVSVGQGPTGAEFGPGGALQEAVIDGQQQPGGGTRAQTAGAPIIGPDGKKVKVGGVASYGQKQPPAYPGGETEEQRRRRLEEAEAFRKYEEAEKLRLGEKEYFRQQVEKYKREQEAAGPGKYRGGALGADYDREHETALDILHCHLRAHGTEVFYAQPQATMTHGQASDWLRSPMPMKVDKAVKESGDTARLHKKFEKKLNGLVSEVTPPELYDCMQDVVIEAARRLSECFVSTSYNNIVSDALISEMQKRGNEILTEVDGAAETYFYASQRLKKAGSLDVEEPCYKVANDLNKKLDDTIRTRPMARKLNAKMRDHIRETANFLSGMVTKPDEKIEAYIALLEEMEAAGESVLIEGDIPKTYQESSEYLRQLTSFQDQIKRPNPTLQAETQKRLQDLMASVPPNEARYDQEVMNEVIAEVATLLTSYVMLHAEKTDALKVLEEEIRKKGDAALLRHGPIRKSYKHGADLLRGKTTDQLAVPAADPVVVRKIQIKLHNLMNEKRKEYENNNMLALMDEVIEDATIYLAVYLLHPKVIQVCKCYKNVLVQCELWCDEILRRVARPSCTCSRHGVAQELRDAAPPSQDFGPGPKISFTTCPEQIPTSSLINPDSETACPAPTPTPECRAHGPTTSYLLYSTSRKLRYDSMRISSAGSSNSSHFTSSSSSPIQVAKQSSPLKNLFQDVHVDTNGSMQFVPQLPEEEVVQPYEAEQPNTLEVTPPSYFSSSNYCNFNTTQQQQQQPQQPASVSIPTQQKHSVVNLPSPEASETSKITQAKSGYSSRTPIISPDQMVDWHAMMVSLMWNLQAWRDWIQEIVNHSLAYQLNPITGEDANIISDANTDTWSLFYRRICTESLQWRHYCIFSRQLTNRLHTRYRNKEIVSPTPVAVKTKTYIECQEEMLEIIDMFNRWTQWLTLVIKETDSMEWGSIDKNSLHQMRWNHLKKKIEGYSKDWIKYDMFLKVSWEQKYSTVIADYLPAWKKPGPVWVVSACGAVPSGAVAAGVFDGEVIWVARTTHRSKVLPAALYPSKHSCLVYAEGAAHRYTKYQV